MKSRTLSVLNIHAFECLYLLGINCFLKEDSYFQSANQLVPHSFGLY
jgi:hypothetical protein